MRRRLYLKLFLFFFILSATPSLAQLTITNNDTTICAGNSVTLNAVHQARTPITISVPDDQYSAVVNIGFSFTFYGNTYTQCVVSSNGYISFNTANAGLFSPYAINSGIPGNTATYNSILAAYADWDPTVGGSIDYATVGTAPNRKFVVTFCGLPLYSTSCNNLLGIFQVVMYETSNIIDIHLGRKPVCATWPPTGTGQPGATIEGIQNSNGTSALTVGTGSSARNWPFTWTAYHSSHRFAPTTTAATAYTVSAIPYGRIPNINVPYAWYLNDVTQVGASSAPSITVSPTTTSFYTARKIDCSDTLSDTVIVTVINPVISSTAFTNPTTCNGTNGTITLNGLSPNTTYSVSFTSGTVQTQTITSSASGSVVITGLSAGTYSNISVTSPTGCVSNSVGPITIVAGSNPVIAGLSPLNPTCGGSNGAITLNGLLPNTTYSVGYTFGTAQSQSITSSGSGSVVISGLSAGTYSNITVTLNGCTSAAVGPITLTTTPTPVISSTSFTNPTTCGGTNGSITLSGLTPNSSHVISYTSGTTQSQTLNSSATGVIVLTNLPAGTYSNITATLNGCTSSAVGPIALNNPATPVITTINPVNPTTCGGTNGSITLNGLSANTSYIVNYNSPAAQTQTIVSNAAGSVVIANLAAGTYSNITVSLNNCTSNSVGSIILTNPTPPTISGTSFSNPTTCGGINGSITLTGLAGNTSYTLSYTSGTTQTQTVTTNVSGSIVINGLSAGTYSNINVTINGCTSSSVGPVTLTNPPTPVIFSTASTNPTTCGGSNGTITLNGLTANVTYTVNYTAGTAQTQSLTANASGSIVINSLPAGTYSNFTVTVNGCTSASAGPITLSNPATPVISSSAFTNPTTCGGSNGSITLNGLAANATYTVNYTAGTVQSQTLAANASGSIVINNLAAGTYSNFTVTINGCTSNSVGPFTLTSPATPVISSTASSNPTTCGGTDGSITLNGLIANTSYSVSYTSGTPQSQTITSGTSGSVVIGNLGAGTYSAITVTLNGCTSAPVGPITLSNPSSSAPIVSPGPTYCQGQTSTALTATGQNLLWYTLPSGGTGNPAAPVPSTATPGTYTWYVSQTVNACESPRSSITVTVVAKPQPPFVTSNVVYCQGETATALNASGQNIKWYTTSVGGSGTTTTPTPSTTAAGIVTWYVSQTINGCESDRASITVTVYATPPMPTVTSPLLYCKGDAATALTASGQNLLWYANSVGGTGSTTAPVPNTSASGTATYYVTQRINNCESGRAAIAVIVNEKADADINIDRGIICQFDTVTITNNGSNVSSAIYNWSFDGGIVVSGSGSGPYRVTWSSLGTKTIGLSISNSNCTDADSKQVVVKPAPVTEFELREAACIDQVITVQAAWNSLNNTSYTWNFGDATVINGAGAGAYKLMWTTPGQKVISLVTSGGGCKSLPRLDTIYIHETPAAKIESVTADHVCVGDVITLQAALINNGEKYDYQWSPQEFFSVNGINKVEASVRRNGLIYLRVSDAIGCVGIDSILIDAEKCCEVFLPDAFTPNGDGRNDGIRMLGKGNHLIISFRIMNRWGQTVYESGDEKASWDGNLGGVPQPMDTYFYFLKYKCGDEVMEKKGELTLIR